MFQAFLKKKHLDIKIIKHHDVLMRTTLTLDDDLAERLKEIARQGDRSFKEVTNEVIRRGLSVGEDQVEGVAPFRVEASECGLKPGVDPHKLNQIYDELEAEKLGSDTGFGVHEP
jgi:predicted transcriptional regulator